MISNVQTGAVGMKFKEIRNYRPALVKIVPTIATFAC